MSDKPRYAVMVTPTNALYGLPTCVIYDDIAVAMQAAELQRYTSTYATVEVRTLQPAELEPVA